MWSYYGSKTNLVELYPAPKHKLIIEPFAGAAKYSLKHFEHDVVLIDKYEVVIKIWKWLQLCSPNDILRLPKHFKSTDRLYDMDWSCEEEKLFMGFVTGCADARPRNKIGKRKTDDRPNHVNYNLKRIASDLYKIKHWKIILGSYEQLENLEATWFIDPPYQFGGEAYVKGNRSIDFTKLSEWCIERKGQVIVCENTKADWMNFIPIKIQRGTNKSSTEAIWTNETTAYNNVQQKLF